MSKKARKVYLKSTPTWMVAGCFGKHGSADFQDWRNRGFFNPSSGAPVRRIDPQTGLVLVADPLDVAASDILKADKRALRGERGRKARPKKQKATKPEVRLTKEEFYKSWEWRQLRMKVLKEFGRACQCCGATRDDKIPTGGRVRIVVDHIKPISKHWHLRLVRSNLQVLCDECNQGKGNWDETDYRSAAA